MVDGMKVFENNMLSAAQKGFINATDLADYMVKKGMPFRSAYKISGQIVAYCIEKGKVLETLTLEEYKSFDASFEQDVFEEISLKTCVEKRISKGEKVIVEAMPTENGGCFFILTFTYNKKKRYKVKRNESSYIFRAENINDFLDFISTAKKNVDSQQICHAYKLKNNYYLYIPDESRELSHLVMEYGEKTENICHEWLKEHGENLGKVYLQ
jgi:negative regulator of genetic competence, sporulation and motility